MSSNCLSYWFPKLEEAGLPVPKTRIVKTDCHLAELLNCKIPDGWDEFVGELTQAARDMGFPCFLRTGYTSNKHDWRETCFLEREEDVGAHVQVLVEFSGCCDFIGLPTNVWVVRELLPVESLGVAYNGMPVVKEFRFFVDDDEILCEHSYWPRDALPDIPQDVYDSMLLLPEDEADEIRGLARAAGKAVGGRWSVDLLPAGEKWYITDMAKMADSWHWPECPNAPKEDEVLEGFEHLFEDDQRV